LYNYLGYLNLVVVIPKLFLQGQLSNDIDGLEEGEVQLNAYCQHLGYLKYWKPLF